MKAQIKEIKASDLIEGMNLINIGRVERSSEYKNCVVVTLSYSKLEASNEVIFPKFQRVKIEI